MKHPFHDPPREKLLHQGAQYLSDVELLAILLKTGSRGTTVIDLAQNMLQHFGSLQCLLDAGPAEFCQFPGVGLVKFATLQAALNLSQRYWCSASVQRLTLRDHSALEQFLMAKLGQREQEVFAVLFLSAKLDVLAYEELFFGSIASNAIYPRELLKRALKHNAASLIVAHNHPSGDPTPSPMDRQLTIDLKALLHMVDIELIQHVVVGRHRCQTILEI